MSYVWLNSSITLPKISCCNSMRLIGQRAVRVFHSQAFKASFDRTTSIRAVSGRYNQSRQAARDYSKESRPCLSKQAAPKHEACFAFRMTAAFVAKEQRFERDQSICQYDSTLGQHWIASKMLNPQDVRKQRHKSGQDAFFMGSIGTSQSCAFGIADGVGGWADQGIDSTAFAHGLCSELHVESASFPNAALPHNTTLHPVELLQAAYNNVCHNPHIVGGGSTACIAVADTEGILNVANLGDSGFIQIRLNAIHDHSIPQTHAFNTPFQLSQIPPRLLRQIAKFGGKHPFQDMPTDADRTTHVLRHGDVLVFGTDGLWDNLSPEDILVTVATSMKGRGAWAEGVDGATESSAKLDILTEEARILPGSKATLQTEVAQSLVTKAKAASVNTKRDGPFAKALKEAHPREYWSGGKADDICVIVVIALNRAM